MEEEIKRFKDFAKMLKEVGHDMINTGTMTEEYLRKVSNPLELIFNRNLADELDEMHNTIYVNSMMLSNKLTVLVELMNDINGEKGEE